MLEGAIACNQNFARKAANEDVRPTVLCTVGDLKRLEFAQRLLDSWKLVRSQELDLRPFVLMKDEILFRRSARNRIEVSEVVGQGRRRETDALGIDRLKSWLRLRSGGDSDKGECRRQKLLHVDVSTIADGRAEAWRALIGGGSIAREVPARGRSAAFNR